MELDYVGILSEIRIHCISCNPQAMIEQGLRGKGKGDGCFCKVTNKDCPFVITSDRGTGQGIAPSSKVFKKYGLRTLNDKSTYMWGKSHFFFNLYHPNMNWKPPQDIPDINRYGNIVNKQTDIYTLAHCNGNHYDDRKKNLVWLLKSEHGTIEPNLQRVIPTSLLEAGIDYAI